MPSKPLTPEQQAARSAPGGKLAPRTLRQRRAAIAQRTITAHDLMDTTEVAKAFGVTTSSLRVALNNPDVFPALAARLPDPLRRVGQSWVWLRSEVEAALTVTA